MKKPSYQRRQARRSLICCALMLFGNVLTLVAGAAESPQVKRKKLVLSIEEAKTLALAENSPIKSKTLVMEAADNDQSVAIGKFFPELALEANIATYHDRDPLVGDEERPLVARDRNHYDAALVLKQNIFSGLRDINAFGAAKQRKAVASRESQKLKADLLAEVIKLYFGVQLTAAKLEAEMEVKKLRERQLKVVGDKLNQGRATQLEWLQAKQAVSSQVPIVEELEVEIETAKLKLALTTEIELGTEIELSDQLVDVNQALDQTKLPGLNTALTIALEQNPELALMREKLQLAKSDGQVTMAKHKPRVDLTLKAYTTASLKKDVGTQDYNAYMGMISVTVPLFSGLTGVHERRSIAAHIHSDEELLQGKRLTVLESLHQTYRKIELAAHRIKAETENLKLSEELIQQSQNLYDVGRGTLVDVLDSYTQKLNAKRSLLTAMYDRIASVAEVRAILGQIK